ncbi:Anaerobic ribonucleoside-triphosphate reductase [Mycobacteroides abscessus subsp. massiliense]|nr:Anaerobic ribonucleoside-triphosphate reductase [Mycobacteroides abscessus subsp. massiliense]
MRDLTAGTVSKSYALDHLLPKHVAHAHQSGDIHFHDLDYHPFQPLTNCCLIDEDLNQYKPLQHNLYKSLQTFQAVNTEVVLSIVLTNY